MAGLNGKLRDIDVFPDCIIEDFARSSSALVSESTLDPEPVTAINMALHVMVRGLAAAIVVLARPGSHGVVTQEASRELEKIVREMRENGHQTVWERRCGG